MTSSERCSFSDCCWIAGEDFFEKEDRLTKSAFGLGDKRGFDGPAAVEGEAEKHDLASANQKKVMVEEEEEPSDATRALGQT